MSVITPAEVAALKVRKLPKLRERDVAKPICDFLRAERWMVIRLQSGTLRGRHNSFVKLNDNGTPDYVALRTDGSNRVLFIETKRPGEKLRPAQEHWIADARQRGFLVIVADGFEAFHSDYHDLELRYRGGEQ